ncbi:MAG: TetR/AcrR family transcriptional regulator C-terminal domain-containing protein [Coprobacillaceae bacterium]
MKQDRRVQKTVHLYQEALLKLLKKKAMNEISIKELSERAHLHRGTFYAHYKGLTELLYSIERELIEKLKHICQCDEVDAFHSLPYSVLNDLFCFLNEHREIMTILFAKDAYFICEMKTILTIYCVRCAQRLYREATKEEYDFLSGYMVEGMMFVFKEWIHNTNEDKPSSEEMALKLQRVMLLGVDSLHK